MKNYKVNSNYPQSNSIETHQHQRQNYIKELINNAMPRDQPNAKMDPLF